jgi:mRNA-degrading endonuclease RelE of RelBE toxin-antitoxin system
MPYRLIVTRDIHRQIDNLPGNVKAIARQRIANLTLDPRPPRGKELDGHSGHYRLHLTVKYRLIWKIVEEDQLIEIEYVGPKPPDLYDRLGLARPTAKPPEDE